MKKVLFVLGDYLPRSMANGLCIDRTSSECVRSGRYDAACLVADPKNKTSYEEIHGVPVYRVKRAWWLRLSEWRKNCRWGVDGFIWIIVGLYKRLVIRPIFHRSLPHNDQTALRGLTRTLFDLHKTHKFDIVVGVNQPLEALMAVQRLKQRCPDVKFVAYFLDALSGGNPLKGFTKDWMIQRGLEWEKRILPDADAVIMMEASRVHHEKYSRDCVYYDKIRYLDIPLLTPPPKSRSENPFDPKKTNILYSGSINPPIRDPRFILKFIEQYDQENVVWHFIGNISYRPFVKLFEDICRRCPEKIQVHGFMKHDDLTAYLEHADLFFNLGENNPSVVSGKIFEYFSWGKPVISSVSIPDSSLFLYKDRYPLLFMLYENRDMAESRRELFQFIKKNRGVSVPFEKVNQLFYQNTPKAFIDMLDTLCHEDT